MALTAAAEVARLLYQHDAENFGWRENWESMDSDDRRTWMRQAQPFIRAVVASLPFEKMLAEAGRAAASATALAAAIAAFRKEIGIDQPGVEPPRHEEDRG